MSADARRGRSARALLVLIVAGLVLGLPLSAQDDDGGLDRAIDQVEGQPMPLEASPNRLSDQVLPLRLDLNQDRPGPLLELGDPFLGVGPIGPGFELGTGAVWNPGFQVFGSFRSAIQVNDDGRDPRVEWANRLDLFGNLAF
ncbi:MAG: hypothetical protein H6807_18155, partial [Planctomycetes bacterium]|nr:hypothetical protein [Planctomycetota bacterium]